MAAADVDCSAFSSSLGGERERRGRAVVVGGSWGQGQGHCRTWMWDCFPRLVGVLPERGQERRATALEWRQGWGPRAWGPGGGFARMVELSPWNRGKEL